MRFMKLQAGALQLTLFIVVVIALLLATFLILIHTHKRFDVQTDFAIETIDNAHKGIVNALQNTQPFNTSIPIDFVDEDFRNLTVKHDYWGLFEKVSATATIRKNTFTKIALVGAAQPELQRTALYIKDNNRPLVLVGNTRIQGAAYLPKQGVKAGNISGNSYYGSQLIYGTAYQSTNFPKLLPKTLQQLKSNTGYEIIEQQQWLDIGKKNKHQNSFSKPMQIVFSHGPIYLTQIVLTGHIKVQSETKITVDATTILKDVILIAPEIEIRNAVAGRFQCLATKSISIGENCRLDYPSALVVNEKINSLTIESEEEENKSITIAKNSIIKGVVVYLGEPEQKNFKAQIQIGENAKIHGEVYCSKNLELKGIVLGSVYANNFIAAASGSIYQNHIYNGSIIVDALTEKYVGLAWDKSKKAVMKWLY